LLGWCGHKQNRAVHHCWSLQSQNSGFWSSRWLRSLMKVWGKFWSFLSFTGGFLRTFGSQGTSDGKFNYPWGLTTDSMGFIYVCDKENHRIQVSLSSKSHKQCSKFIFNPFTRFFNPMARSLVNSEHAAVARVNLWVHSTFSWVAQFIKAFILTTGTSSLHRSFKY
jgi:hypothetical protein